MSTRADPSLTTVAVVSLQLMLLASAPLCAQRTIAVAGGPECTRCTVRIEHVVSLGVNSTISLARSTRAVKIGSAWAATPTYDPGAIAVFSQSGRLSRTIGRVGGGPGEFSGGRMIIAVGEADSLHVVDGSRWTVLTPDSFKFGRSLLLRGVPGSIAATPRGELIASYPGSDSIGIRPVHALDATGVVLASFGQAAGPRSSAFDLWDTVRRISSSEAGIWIARINRFELVRVSPETWSEDVRVTAEVPWFPEWSGYEPLEPLYQRPRPQLVGAIQVDSVLYALAAVPDEAWEPADERPAAGEEIRSVDVDTNALFDGLVLAIDLSTARIIAELRSDEILYPVAGAPEALQRVREGSSGEVIVEIVRVHLESR